MSIRRLNTKGDTIVEVLLAIAVVSAILGGAYVATNRSLGGVRQSQERGEALKYIEGQVERLKEAAKASTTPGPNNVFTAATDPFCLSDTLAVQTPTSPSCNPDRYRLQIDRTSSGDTFTFVASATWVRLGGGQERLDIRYKAYRP